MITDCYDKYGSKIIGAVCETNTGDLTVGFMFMFALFIMIVILYLLYRIFTK